MHEDDFVEAAEVVVVVVEVEGEEEVAEGREDDFMYVHTLSYVRTHVDTILSFSLNKTFMYKRVSSRCKR